MPKKLIVSACVLLFFTGCRMADKSFSPNCTIAAVHSATEIDICLGKGDLNDGDALIFYKKVCSTASRGSPSKCKNERIGDGVVVKVLDEHLSTVRLESEIDISKIVEVKRNLKK